MGSPVAAWWETREDFESALSRHDWSITATCRALGGIKTTKARRLFRLYEITLPGGVIPGRPDTRPTGGKRRDVPRPGVVIDGDEATVTGDLTTDIDLGDVENLLRARKLNPDDWVVKSATVNEWEGPAGGGEVTTYRQIKVQIIRKLAFPVVTCAALPPKAPRPERISVSEPRLVALFGCAQAPYHDEALHLQTLRWLVHNKPAEWVDLGDLADFSTISRHRDNPAFSAATQDCVNAGFRILNDRVQVLPTAKRSLLKGNHDDRIRTEMLNRSERMQGLKAGWEEGEEPPEYDQLSLYYLWHMERLGIEYVGPERDGDYEQAFIELSPEVEVRHGHLIGKGTSANMLRSVGRSIAVAHTHKQEVYEATVYRHGLPTRMSAMQVGTLCNPHGGLGYAVNPEWQQGFGTATIWPDGRHVFELARYHDGILSWRDQRWAT